MTDPKRQDSPEPNPPNQKPGQPKASRDPLPRNYSNYEHWPQRFAERRARIKRIADVSLLESAEAMCVLDEWTDPKHVDIKDPKLARAISELTVYLLFRALHRTAWAIRDLPFESPPFDETQRTRATQVEELFRKAMQAAFPAPAGTGLPFDLRKFERTFACFTVGEVAMREVAPVTGVDRLALDGMPDGAYYFCFAEAALLFLRLDLQPEFWRRTLPTLVAGTSAFTLNYWDGSHRVLDAYKGAHRRHNMTRNAMLASIRQHYGVLDLPRLLRTHGDVLATALRDEPSLPHAAPTPKEFR